MSRLIVFLTIFLSINSILFATVYTTVTNGNWNNNSTWDANGKPGTYWNSGDQVIVNHLITLNQSIGFAGSLTISTGSSLIGSNRNISLNNEAGIVANGSVSVNNLTLNSTSSGTFSKYLTVGNNLTVGSSSTLVTNDTVQVNGKFDNNGGEITAGSLFSIVGNLTNNNGIMTFNDKITVGGSFNNNNSSAVIIINDDFEVSGNVQNNSSATMNIGASGNMDIGGNLTNNNGTTINNEGTIQTAMNFQNNGGTMNNDNIFLVDGNFTQNNGMFTNDGVTAVDGDFTVNGGGTVNGSGMIRTDNITNYGTVSGSNDICRRDDSTPTSQAGGGSYSGSTSYCTESSSAALPITLLYFNAVFKDQSILFEWSTATELNNNYFQVQYSENGRDFLNLLKESGSGNSETRITYQKQIPILEKNYHGYYRLKQTDFDGKFSYSKVVYLNKVDNRIENDILSVYPNPIDGSNLNVKVVKVNSPLFTLRLFDVRGTIILTKEIYLENRVEEFELLQGLKLEPGIYFLHTIDDFHEQTQKIVVQGRID